MSRIEFDYHRNESDFINRLCAEALNSSAVNHPYLDAFRQGDFPNIDLAIKDFAMQYGVYSTRFIRFVSSLMNNLSDPVHRQILQTNLDEEKGKAHEVELPEEVMKSVLGQPHINLFRRFQNALGVDADYRNKSSSCDVALRWSRQFHQLCEQDECVGVGAIGIATELIVSSIYQQILEGLKAHSNLTMTQRVFFHLHSQCDDDHAAQLLMIAEEMAVDQRAREKIEYGVNKAIKLRTTFWDHMLERAQGFSASNAVLTAS